jgi:hypothetical protein
MKRFTEIIIENLDTKIRMKGLTPSVIGLACLKQNKNTEYTLFDYLIALTCTCNGQKIKEKEIRGMQMSMYVKLVSILKNRIQAMEDSLK